MVQYEKNNWDTFGRCIAFLMTACGSEENVAPLDTPQTSVPESSSPEVLEQPEAEGMDQQTGSHILVAYFSWADNVILEEDVDAVSSPSVIAPGNVQELAGWVQEETGGDLFPIRVTEPYPSDWDDCLARANQERGDQARPALEETVENLDQYDTVFLGFPIWWYTAPRVIQTFLESYDFTGKTIILFATSGGSDLGRTAKDLAPSCPGAVIRDGQIMRRGTSQEELKRWVAKF